MIKVKWKLTLASLKMFSRQREALIWTMLLPLFMVCLFGFVNFEDLGKIRLGVTHQGSKHATQLVKRLKKIQTVELSEGSEANELNQLKAGERHLVLVIPSAFDPLKSNELKVLVNNTTPQETQLGLLVLRKVLDDMIFVERPLVNRIRMKSRLVTSQRRNYIDFLLPGMISLAIMQSGIFGVAFGFVSLRKRGVLRRLSVTPIKPQDFIVAQIAMRLIVLVSQMTVLLGVGILFFDLNFMGNLVEFFVFGLLGGCVFLAIGFLLAGIAKTEDQVAPLANAVSLPMMLLSGVFFSRSNLPGWVQAVSEFFPLTYLADAMRSIALEGVSLFDMELQFVGLSCWCLISVGVAVRVFRWD